jgi:hypothetical protein
VICLAAIAAASGGWLGCAPPPEMDPDAGVPPGGPEPTNVEPGWGAENVFVDKVIRVTFSDHLDSRSFKQSRVDLYSGSISKWTMSYYDPVRSQMVVWPSSNMLKSVYWVLALDEGITGIDGKPVAPQAVAYFKTGEQEGDNEPFAHRSFSAEVEPIFDRRCISCHGGKPGQGYADLRLDSEEAILSTAVGVKSSGWADWDIIAPARPGESYLLYKIIDDERIAGTSMPRAADLDGPAEPLTKTEQETLADWIVGGALFFDPEIEGD